MAVEELVTMKRQMSISFGRLALGLFFVFILAVGATLAFSSSAYAEKPQTRTQYKVFQCNACVADRVESVLNAYAADGWKFRQANGSWLIFEK